MREERPRHILGMDRNQCDFGEIDYVGKGFTFSLFVQ